MILVKMLNDSLECLKVMNVTPGQQTLPLKMVKREVGDLIVVRNSVMCFEV